MVCSGAYPEAPRCPTLSTAESVVDGLSGRVGTFEEAGGGGDRVLRAVPRGPAMPDVEPRGVGCGPLVGEAENVRAGRGYLIGGGPGRRSAEQGDEKQHGERQNHGQLRSVHYLSLPSNGPYRRGAACFSASRAEALLPTLAAVP